MPNQLRERELNEVAAAFRIIRRHFDNVLIVANKHDLTENRTVAYQASTGNFEALEGQALKFLSEIESNRVSIYDDDGETIDCECDEDGDAPLDGDEPGDNRGNKA